MNLDNLSKYDLTNLKVEVDKRLNTIVEHEEKVTQYKKDNSPKTQIGELVNGDMIFCIQYWIHTNKLYFSGYCKVDNFDVNDLTYPKYRRIDISHDYKPVGVVTSVAAEYLNKSYFFHDGIGTISFYTLTPETWEKDLVDAATLDIGKKMSIFNENVENFEAAIERILSEKEVIEREFK